MVVYRTCLAGILVMALTAGGTPPAFPGAEGAGAFTPGGRGGRVLAVTTLADYEPGRRPAIPGSLRAALEAKGPRIVHFRVAGTIDLVRDLAVTEPYLTLAGQTAPGDGVCLKGSSLKIATHDVIVRHLRVRPGDIQGRELDCISSRGHDVILDHCSATWGIDETISTNGDSGNVTVQWCLIAESLNRSAHHKGEHGYGSLISGTGPISYHHNLYAFHRSRSPRGGDVLLDFRNNIVFGWGDRAGYSGDDRLDMNYVNNFLQPLGYSRESRYAFKPGGTRQRIHIVGNHFVGFEEGSRDNSLLLAPIEGRTEADTAAAVMARVPHPTATVSTDPALVARARVLAEVGATRPTRDAVDQRIVALVADGQGRLVDSQEEVGGWADLKGAEPPPDRDEDGMPDDWEERHGFASGQFDSGSADGDGDSYTDIEEYLNDTDPRVAEPWLPPPVLLVDAGDDATGPAVVSMRSDEPGTVIRYTIDGSEPSPSSTVYWEPIRLDADTVVRARAWRGELASQVANHAWARRVPRVAAEVSNASPGLAADYFEVDEKRSVWEIDQLRPVRSFVSPHIAIDSRRRDAGFGFRFSGYFQATQDGAYTFWLRCSPRGVLWIGEQIVVESQSSKRVRSGAINLKRGLHPLRFAILYGSPVDKTFQLEIAGPDGQRQPLPPELLWHNRDK